MIQVFNYVDMLVQQRLVLFVEEMLLLREFISRPIYNFYVIGNILYRATERMLKFLQRGDLTGSDGGR